MGVWFDIEGRKQTGKERIGVSGVTEASDLADFP